MQALAGGFHAGGGANYSWFKNMMVGPVPVTATLTVGGMAEVKLDVLASAYRRKTGSKAIQTGISAA